MALPSTVSVRGLSHWFGQGEQKKQVLYENDLEIAPGEIVIMTGPSGSGKTTLLTLIGALRSVQEGSVRIQGEELRSLRPSQLVLARRKVGFIFQAHNLFMSLSARENVCMALELHRHDRRTRRRKAEEILTQLGLRERVDYKPEALSGGQRQRVAIARALVNEPPLVLADEPTAALDKDTGRQVVDLLRSLADQRGLTIMIVTHDNRILDVADRIVNMVDGRVTSDAAVRETVQVCEFLVKSQVFRGQSPQMLAEFAQKMRAEQYAAGSTLVQQGGPPGRFYVIRSGHCTVEVRTGDEVKQVARLGPGEHFGEAALITGGPRNATVKAETEVQLLSLSQEEFKDALSRSESFDVGLRKALYTRGS